MKKAEKKQRKNYGAYFDHRAMTPSVSKYIHVLDKEKNIVLILFAHLSWISSQGLVRKVYSLFFSKKYMLQLLL